MSLRAPSNTGAVVREPLGRKRWAIPEGYIPAESHGPSPEMTSHEAVWVDLQEQEDGERSHRNIPQHNVDTVGRSARVPPPSELSRAADLLDAARKPVLLVGQGALAAAQELVDVAERIGAPIVKALLGKAAVPDDSPYATGGIGLLGTRPSQEAIEDGRGGPGGLRRRRGPSALAREKWKNRHPLAPGMPVSSSWRVP
jgi:hypothetical protein